MLKRKGTNIFFKYFIRAAFQEPKKKRCFFISRVTWVGTAGPGLTRTQATPAKDVIALLHLQLFFLSILQWFGNWSRASLSRRLITCRFGECHHHCLIPMPWLQEVAYSTLMSNARPLSGAVFSLACARFVCKQPKKKAQSGAVFSLACAPGLCVNNQKKKA